MYPMGDTVLLPDDTLGHFGRVSRNHLPLTFCEWPCQIEESRDGRCMPILLNQGAERLHQVPGRRIDLRLETRMNVLLRTTSPLFTAGHEFQFDDTLRTECDLEAAIGILIGARQQHAHTGLQCLEDIWGHYNFAEMWRADFLFPLANEYQVDRQLFTGRIERHQGAQKRILRTLLVHRTASHADRSELFFGYQSAFPRR